jgi:hypothetical protein
MEVKIFSVASLKNANQEMLEAKIDDWLEEMKDGQQLDMKHLGMA